MTQNFENRSRKMQENNVNISLYMKTLFENYNDIRGKDRNKEPFSFWDMVVISAADYNQQAAYEMQISIKQEHGELPLGVPIRIISDPAKNKIGCGGSTMYALAMLTDLYRDALVEKRVLFIPAGGHSQRLPSQSVMGKLFSPIPLGDPMYQMIDLIFAVYLPFLSKMTAGLFLTSSDAIISFFLEDNGNWSFQNPGFTALGHPSSIAVGTNHGVYVLPESQLERCSSFMSECIRVLQKPTEELMREKGAVVRGCKDLGTDHGKDIVYSDSVFFFDMDIAVELAQFFKEAQPLSVEISSYGDFLQPLGKSANTSYIGNANNEISRIRTELYELLHNKPLHVLALNQSAFHHLGTMDEYIENYCSEGLFTKHFQCSRFLSSSYTEAHIPALHVKGIVLHALLHPKSVLAETAIIEYCSFLDIVHVAENCIVSNCKVDLPSDSTKPLPIQIPQGMLLHTVAVEKGFVTIFFNIHDNLKAICRKGECCDLPFLNKKLKDIQDFKPESDVISLWTAKLFPVFSSMDTSFRKAVDAINTIMNGSKLCDGLSKSEGYCMSMADILQFKDVKKMLEFRKELHKSICKCRAKLSY